VLGWYEKFPEFKTNDLYISGESYAGIYVPYLLYLMHNYIQANLDNPDAFLPPLKGMMVGNGVTNWKYDGSPSAFEMSYWHSLVDKDLYM
jgi:carboxypeptidase C (cathepsin A)